MGYKNLPHNYLKYPNVMFAPRNIQVQGKTYKLHTARFNSLYTLYDYLKSNPETNSSVFRVLESEAGTEAIAGKPYDQAVEDLLIKEDVKYDEFLRLQGSISSAIKAKSRTYETVKTLSGGQLNIPAYSAGDPYCFDELQRVKKPKFIKIHVLVSFNGLTRPKQIENRAIILANLIKALENAGYSVDIDAFELSYLDDEIEYMVVKIKNHGEKTKLSTLYKVLCHVEFFRRILFRVMETMDFENSWQAGYGNKCKKEFTYDFLKIGKNDLYFDQPTNMGIRGYDLAEDFENAIDYLNLNDKIDVEKAKENFKKEAIKLKLKR